MEQAGFEDYTVGCANIRSEHTLTNDCSPEERRDDARLSQQMPAAELDAQACYFFVQAQGQRALDAGYPPIAHVREREATDMEEGAAASWTRELQSRSPAAIAAKRGEAAQRISDFAR